MRYLGIDYGTKRVGIATSDLGGVLAFPLSVLTNTKALCDEIAAICRKEQIDMIVIGESHDFSGKPNPLMQQIIPFKEKLGSLLKLPTVLHTEVLSSQEAKRIQGDNDMNDASAAAIILQSYLDREADRKKKLSGTV